MSFTDQVQVFLTINTIRMIPMTNNKPTVLTNDRLIDKDCTGTEI